MIPQIVINVVALIVTLGILVTFHEFGHFWVARRCGVKVLRFSIGFGKAAKMWKGKDGVEYVIAPIPLGGYVKMLGQEDTGVVDAEDTPASERHLSFAYKPLWQRVAIVAAGPIANFILAIFVFWLINISFGSSGVSPVVHSVIDDSPAYHAGLLAGDEIVAVDGDETALWQHVNLQLLARMGETGQVELTVLPGGSSTTRTVSIPINAWLSDSTEPNPLDSLGIIDVQLPAVLEGVLQGGRAEAAGLQAGDEIVSVNGMAISGWTHWVKVIRSSPELDLLVVVKRSGNETDVALTPASVMTGIGEIGSIGASVEPRSISELIPEQRRREIDYNVVTAIKPALVETWDKSLFVLDSVKKMLVGLISVRNVNGPITIAQVAGETASYGLEVYLGFLALLSISLGVLNLLPIPVLDGGHLLYYLIEAITRRPVPEKVQAWGLQLGILFVSGIMVLAFYNDVTRLLL